MIKRFITLCFLFIFISSSLFAIPSQDTIDYVDTLFLQRHQPGKVKQTIQLLENAISDTSATLTTSQQYDLYWRLSRSYSYLNDDVVPDFDDMERREKLNLFFKGETYANKATELNPKGVLGHYWKGVLIGRTAEYRGILESLFAVKPIKESMEKVIELNPKHAGAHFVLARLHRKAPPLISVGNIKLAENYIEKSVSLHPTRTLYVLELGKIYKKRKKWDKAKKAFEDVINMPDKYSDFQPDVDDHKAKAKVLLNKLN